MLSSCLRTLLWKSKAIDEFPHFPNQGILKVRIHQSNIKLLKYGPWTIEVAFLLYCSYIQVYHEVLESDRDRMESLVETITMVVLGVILIAFLHVFLEKKLNCRTILQNNNVFIQDGSSGDDLLWQSFISHKGMLLPSSLRHSQNSSRLMKFLSELFSIRGTRFDMRHYNQIFLISCL